MTVLSRTEARRQAGATATNRRKKEANGKRVEEIGAVMDVESSYTKADRAGDLKVESLIQKVYDLADDDEERDAAAQLLAAWWKAEKAEERAVIEAVQDAANLLRHNNTFWLGAWTPENSDGAA